VGWGGDFKSSIMLTLGQAQSVQVGVLVSDMSLLLSTT
jgi:hypothetical protein